MSSERQSQSPRNDDFLQLGMIIFMPRNPQLFDAAGNMTQIGGWMFKYDAENHQTSAAINTTTSTYAYDGEGRRVQKVSGGETTLYVYDAQGDLMAEYEGPSPSQPPLCQTCYVTVDHLGSTRLEIDGVSGQPVAYHDYLPFGEEVTSVTGDTTTQKFTGKERDAETGLDNFIARYLSGAQGRFTSADPENTGSDPGDPQSWNGYAYGRNNPLLFTDPTGRNYTVCDTNGKNCADLTDQQYADYRNANPNVYQTPGGTLNYVNENGSETTIGSAQYYNEKDVQAAQFIVNQVGPFVNGLGVATGAIVAGASLGIAYGAYTGGTALIGLGVASGPAIFQAGQIIDKVVNTSAGPVRFVAEVDTSGSQLILKDILVYPAETGSQIAVGVKEILQAARPLMEQARQAGFTSVRFIADRSAAAGSANPGRPVDFTRTLK
jgi:RHS repeat-associated protein